MKHYMKHKETRAWESSNHEVASEMRKAVRERVQVLADQKQQQIEICSYDGIVFDTVHPQEA